jgi:hypothetical protein
MQRMYRKMFAALLGVLAVTSFAAAQSPPPQPFPAIPIAPIPVAAPPAPSVLPATVRPVSGGFNAVELKGMSPRDAAGTILNPPAIPNGTYGVGCANGCGSFKGDLGFVFGSCKSYFNACGPEPCDYCNGSGGGLLRGGGKCGGGLCGGLFGGKCPTHPLGQPYNTPGPCQYWSYMDR